jgi:tRNA (guanine37-N1)-methyltransferase
MFVISSIMFIRYRQQQQRSQLQILMFAQSFNVIPSLIVRRQYHCVGGKIPLDSSLLLQQQQQQQRHRRPTWYGSSDQILSLKLQNRKRSRIVLGLTFRPLTTATATTSATQRTRKKKQTTNSNSNSDSQPTTGTLTPMLQLQPSMDDEIPVPVATTLSTVPSLSKPTSDTSLIANNDNNISDENQQPPPSSQQQQQQQQYEDDESIQQLTQTWRNHPSINPNIAFPIWICTNGQSIQSLLTSPIIQPYLASQLEFIEHLHIRFRVVRNYETTTTTTTTPTPTMSISTTTTANTKDGQHSFHNIDKNTKILLLCPGTPRIKDLPKHVQSILYDAKCFDGPEPYNIQFQYHQFTASFILNQLLPKSIHPVPTAFEMVGHVAHLNLRNHHLSYRTLIGEVLLETLPTIDTVIQKIGDVSGPHRTFQYEVLAGKTNNTVVQLVESGVQLQFDLQHVYWCSRLFKERQRLLQHEILNTKNTHTTRTKNNNMNRTIVVADVFCGVGALCIQAAVANPNIEIWANDWNPYATAALRENAIRNSIPNRQLTRLCTTDAYTFLMDLGMTPANAALTTTSTTVLNTTSSRGHDLSLNYTSKRRKRYLYKVHRTIQKHSNNDEIRLPDHVVMNFPLEAPKFLGALRWWPSDACGDYNTNDNSNNNSSTTTRNNNLVKPRIHVYTFVRHSGSNIDGSNSNEDEVEEADDDDIQYTDQSVEDLAVDMVADNLLPQLTPNGSPNNEGKSNSDTMTMKADRIRPCRRQELNDVYHCNIKTHVVRDVAPGKVVVCVSFTVTSKLLRHMRGDFL